MIASAAIPHRAAPVAAGLQNFTGDGDRKRLTGTAVKAVLRLVDAWGGNNAEGAVLLGVPESAWDRIKVGKWNGTSFSRIRWPTADRACPIAARSSAPSRRMKR